MLNFTYSIYANNEHEKIKDGEQFNRHCYLRLSQLNQLCHCFLSFSSPAQTYCLCKYIENCCTMSLRKEQDHRWTFFHRQYYKVPLCHSKHLQYFYMLFLIRTFSHSNFFFNAEFPFNTAYVRIMARTPTVQGPIK